MKISEMVDTDTLRAVLSTWPGRFYVGLLIGLTVGVWQMTDYIGSEPTTTSGWLSVSVITLAVGLVAAAYFFSREHLMWTLKANLNAGIALFAIYFVWALATGVSGLQGILDSPGLRLMLAAFFALATAEIATIIAFVIVVLTRGFGGDGESPEEQILDDGLDL